MSFFIGSNEIDLGFTSIENIFLNDFMPMADGIAVKVYLLGFKFARDQDPSLNVTNTLISRHLNIPLADVLRSWDFWEEKGIITKHPKDSATNPDEDYDVEFKSLIQLYVENNYQMFMPKKPKAPKDTSKSANAPYKSTVDDLVAISQNPYVSNMFKKIDHIIRRQLRPNERLKVIDWFNNYNVDPDVIVEAFYIAVEKRGKKNINYVDGIVRNWYDLGITNSEDLEEYMKNSDEKHLNYREIKKAIGASSLIPSESERRIMDRWLDEWNMSMELILKACEKSANTANPSINYINGVLASWKEKGVKTVEDADREDKLFSEQNKQKQQNTPKTQNFKTKFHNFEQRSSKYSKEELDKLVEERQKNK